MGFGTNSIVWLARDEKTQSFVAIKISVASAMTTHEESDILRMLSSKTTAPSSKKSHAPTYFKRVRYRGSQWQTSMHSYTSRKNEY